MEPNWRQKLISVRRGANSCLWIALVLGGCRSPYYADKGAVVGGLTGAGVGAAIGEATSGEGAAGAIVGSAVGAMTGTLIGEGLDEINARNEALIEERMGRPMVGAATIQDTVAMTQAGLSDDVIVNYLRGNGLTGQLQASDLIHLKQQGVSDAVLGAMQEVTRPASVAPVAVAGAPPPVIVEEHYHGPPPWYYRPRPHWGYHRHPAHRPIRWGFSFSSR